MYFPIGWPKAVSLSLPNESTNINHISCDAVKILVAAIGDDFLGVWYANPLIPITYYRRRAESVAGLGTNRLIIWKPDSRKLAVLTSTGSLLLYKIDFDINGNGGVLTQVDSPNANLKRDSAELFIKENIPRLNLTELCSISLSSFITTLCCISLTELIIATEDCELIKTQWTELEEGSGHHAVINLRNIPFYMNQNSNLKSLPPIGANHFVSAMEYSPFIGGCAVVFNDRRAAFLIATHLRFEEQKMHGFWVPDIDDATVCSVNHKFRLLAYGRKNSDVAVYAIEDTTGGLEYSHKLSLNSKVLPGTLGAVNELKWSPDGCVLAVSWDNGGFSLWSTFGALLMSSLGWEFGIHIDLLQKNPLMVSKMEWSTEGYQLFMTCSNNELERASSSTNVLLLGFVKSTLSMNPCMTSNAHVLLQGDDTLYLNLGDNLEKIYFGSKFSFPNNHTEVNEGKAALDDNMEIKKGVDISSILSESKYWNVLQLPLTYAATNWPVRYSAIDNEGLHLAVAGRTGLAHYSMLTKKWKLFGNESQEKDFVVSGGLLWWKGFIVMGCYSLLDRIDEIRCYPEECKLDNQFGNKIQVRAPVISLNMFKDQLIVLTADGLVSMFVLTKISAFSLNVDCTYEVDVKSICIHPACIVSLTVTNLKNDLTTKSSQVAESNTAAETIIVNVCGRILMIQRDMRSNVINSLMASCLASCVEVFWLSNAYEKSPMRDCLWLYSGAHGMRVWLPILPPLNEEVRDASHRLHTFMSKRIMLSFPLKLYPLVILFDDVIVLGVENETTLYTSEQNSHFSLPFCMLERKSQVYLHKILRQLIKRNLGYSAWEIAKSCRALPYFPHALELLLHEVLEEEATSKDPIPDALLPSILDFIREFPVYMQTIVQCARKTEIALWPYLFSMAGKPKDLFQQCLQSDELETAASYLIILQNLEPSVISKQYATLLLDISLENRKWELAKDLIRFLKAIDPNEIDSPRSSMVVNVKIAPPSQTQAQVNQNPEVFNLILGPIARERSFSTTVIANVPKVGKEKTSTITPQTANLVGNESAAVTTNPNGPVIRRKSERSNSTKEKKETFFIDSILQRHARTLLQKCKLIDLGYMSAFLDFHLVSWLSQEKERTAKLEDFVETLVTLHKELNLPPPFTRESSEEFNSGSDIDLTGVQHGPAKHLQNTSSQTSESGYFSLALMDTPTSTNNGNSAPYQIPAIQEHEELHYSSLPAQSAVNQPAGEFSKLISRSNSQISFENPRFRRFSSLNDDVVPAFALGLDCVENTLYTSIKLLPEKLAVKMRYLLQLFTEANCIDYALVLSILLQDAASIGRIINAVIRSESLATCNHIEAALARITHWTFAKNCVYRTFMIALQPHLYLLNQYIQSTSSSASSASFIKRKSETSILGDTSMPSDAADGLTNISQTKNITNSNSNWSMENYPHEGSRILRQTSSDSSGKHSIAQPTSTSKKRNSRDEDGLKEPSGCKIM